MKNSKKYLMFSFIILLIVTLFYFVKIGVDNKVGIEATKEDASTVFDTNTMQEQSEEELQEETDVVVEDGMQKSETQAEMQEEAQEENKEETGNIEETEETENVIADMPVPISVQGITTTRLSKKKIQIAWSDRDGDLVEQYILKKRDALNE